MVLIAVFAAVCVAPVVPTIDALVMYSLTDARNYGKQRLWGAVGYWTHCVSHPVAGFHVFGTILK